MFSIACSAKSSAIYLFAEVELNPYNIKGCFSFSQSSNSFLFIAQPLYRDSFFNFYYFA
jgi:hypothetical protein